ncbi:MAG TPA: hypothetical protein PK074_09015 [Spirochaetales bacterium]|nr:hypothetical protein [Spirochaetales bacterium]
MKRFIPALLILIVFAVSCDNGPVGIFASIGSESPIEYKGTEVFKKSTPAAVVSRNGTLYAVITTLWKKNGNTWEKATNLPSQAMYATSAAVTGTTLYVAFLDSNAHSLGVFSTTDDSNWTPVDITFPANDEQVQQLLAVNNKVFAVTTKAVDGKTQYNLYHLSSGSFVSLIRTGTNLFSLAYVGSTYYVASGTTIWISTDLANFQESLTLADDFFTSITSIGGKPTAVTAFGKVYWHEGGWYNTNALTKSSKNLYLHAPVEYNDTLFVATNTVVRKTSSVTEVSPIAGYIELAFPLSTTKTQRDDNSLVTATNTVFSATIGGTALSMLTLITENGKPTLYAGSVGNGLWSNRNENGSWLGWQRETD